MQRTSSRSNLVSFTLNHYSQKSDTGRNSTGSILYFVISTGLTEDTCSHRLILAKKLCEDFYLYSEWLPEEQLLHKTPQNNNVYVLDPFSGAVYDYLEEHFMQNKKFMITGPQCIKYAVQQPEFNNPIQSKGYPFCSLAMQNICITLTGFSKEIAAELTDLVQKMNGVVSKVYSAATTHVVAENTLTAKCREAYKNDILVMTCTWIRTVWKECQDELVDATDVKFIKHNCPVFHNIEICVSQIPSKIKAALESTITANGGSYSKQFKRSVTDLLVTPFASGEKYKYARQWGIPCVTPEWIDQSKQAGHVLPFDLKFQPKRLPTEELCSTQLENKKGPLPDFSNLTALSDINEGSGNNSKMELVNSTSYLTDLSRVSAVQQQVNIPDSTLEFLHKAPAGFLDGCTAYLCGQAIGDEKIGEIRKILNSSGATRSDKISERVSHVLVIHSRISEKEIQSIKALDNVPHVVSLEWLIQSAKQASPADEERFCVEVPSLKKNISEVKEKPKPPQASNFRAVTPGVPKPKAIRSLEQGSNSNRLDNTSETETPPPKHPVKTLKESIIARSISFSTAQSPLIRPGMSREGSKQLKKALAFVCDTSPESSSAVSMKRRCSTPFQKVREGFLDAVEEKAKRRKVQGAPNNTILQGLPSTDAVDKGAKVEDDDDSEDDGISMAEVAKVLLDAAPDSSHQEDFEEENKNESEPEQSSVPTDVNNRSSNGNKHSIGYGSKNSAASSIQIRKSSPVRPKPKVSSKVTRAKFGVLRDLDTGDEHSGNKLGVDWTGEKKTSNSEECLESTESKIEEPSSRISDDESEIRVLNSPPKPDRRQTRQTRKESQSSTKSSTSSKRRDDKANKKRDNNKSSRPYVFILSGCSGAEKIAAMEVIEALGGIVSSLEFYDNTANAVIAYKVTRSEKILGAIAGGLPILHPTYLTASHSLKRLLEFKDFIWKEDDGSTPAEQNMARVAQSWYERILMDPSNKPFSKFRVYLSEQKVNKKEAFKRLIEAGGGKVFTSLDDINIVIGDGMEAVGQAAQSKVPVKIPMYLNDVILNNVDISWLVQ